MRISTKGRGIIKAQQGTVARPNPKENKDNPDRVNVQQQGFRGANVNMKDANGNYYIDPNWQFKRIPRLIMEKTNELVTAAEARAEGLSLDGVANNRCITKQQFVDNLPKGGYC